MTNFLIYLLFISTVNAFLFRTIDYGMIFHGWYTWLSAFRPKWINPKVFGECIFCTCFWVGVVEILGYGLFAGGAYYLLAGPFIIAVLSEKIYKA